MKGHLNKKDFCVPGNESSQYITGILLAQTVCGGTLHVSGRLESAPYVEITLDLMRKFGICTERSQNENGSDFKIQRLDINEKTARTLTVGGDWSGAANLIAAGATALGLDENSAQGDRAILDILISTGASVEKSDGISAYIEGKAKAADVDMRDTPDLVPLVAVLCANAKGKSFIRGTRRLRLKESDRVESTLALLGALGIEAKATEDSIEITGGDIRGGEVDSFGDHRIAMAAAVASCFANGDITVRGAECVAKSFPPFWETFRSLGASFTQI
jgi:3-phosphoshikimate 1-carboxyvinyltransferase